MAMRAWVIRCSKIDKMFVHRYADLFDLVRDLPYGGEIYFCDSERELYIDLTLKKLEETLNLHHEAAEEYGQEHYAPCWPDAMMIKKTEKYYIVKYLKNEIK
jgi:hypothetical protein